jgi:hypothetical protein
MTKTKARKMRDKLAREAAAVQTRAAQAAALKESAPARPKGRRQRGRVGGVPGFDENAYVTNFVNPWSSQVGKQWPVSAVKCVPIRLREIFKLGGNSDGTLRALLMLPRINLGIYATPVYTAGTPTVFPLTGWGSANSWTDYGANVGILARYRINSFGVRVYSTSSLVNTAGSLTLATTSSDVITDGYSPNQNFSSKMVQGITGGIDISVVSKPIDNSAHEFKTWGATAQEISYDWEKIFVFMEGTTTDTDITVEAVMDIEAIPLAQTVVARMTQPPVPNNPGLAARIDNASRSVNSFQETLNRAATAVGTMANLGYSAYRVGRSLGGLNRNIRNIEY